MPQETLDKHSDRKDVIVYVDTREFPSGVARHLFEKGVTVRRKQLPVADYQITDIGCERKTNEDFIQSIIDNRLFKQVKDLAENFGRTLLIIEGKELYGLRDISADAIRGALSCVALDYRTPIIFTNDAQDTASLIALIARREQLERKREVQIRGEIKPLTLPEQQRFIVEGLPGVGPTLAKNLLKKFGSVENVMRGSEAELKKVEKLGDKKAKEIRKVLTTRCAEGVGDSFIKR